MPTVLVVEDADSNAQLVKAALESKGHHVVCARTGEEGVRLARELHPKLILMDLRLPYGMDGWKAIEHIKADSNLASTPIVVISVEILPEDRERAFAAGCELYYAKPFSVSQLIDVVGKYT